ncbi:MAG: hypothetical protein EXS25_06555, partial [Pedosphaera sp.]|nr:hypothetical protein [Pedosphaera sp.]
MTAQVYKNVSDFLKTVVLGLLAFLGGTTPLHAQPPLLALEAYIKANNLGTIGNSGQFQGDWFGVSVAVSGDTAVVGAPRENSDSTGVNSTFNEAAENSGAAYVFVRNLNGTWTQQAYLKASNTGQSDGFGTSVAVSGDTVVVGAS